MDVRALSIGALIATLALTAVASPIRAQTLSGTLVDENTLQGIDGATITLQSSTRFPLDSILTDDLGRFTVEVPGFGAYFINARHLAYGAVSTPAFNITAEPGDTVTLTFYLTAQAITLDPILVDIPTVAGADVFAERLERGQGILFTPEFIDSVRPQQHVGEIFRHADDDIFMRWTAGLKENGEYGPVPVIRSYRGGVAGARGAGGGCLDYIVDRTPVPDPFFAATPNVWGVSPLADLKPEDLVAVEIYRGWWEVPKDYEDQILANTLGKRRKLRDMRLGECGVVVIWTTEGWGARLPGSSR